MFEVFNLFTANKSLAKDSLEKWLSCLKKKNAAFEIIVAYKNLRGAGKFKLEIVQHPLSRLKSSLPMT